jgi:hypothetical protein
LYIFEIAGVGMRLIEGGAEGNESTFDLTLAKPPTTYTRHTDTIHPAELYLSLSQQAVIPKSFRDQIICSQDVSGAVFIVDHK